MDLNDFKKKPVIRKIEVGRVIEVIRLSRVDNKLSKTRENL